MTHLLTIIFAIFTLGESEKILFMVYHDTGSHFGSITPFFTSLAKKGHQVTIFHTVTKEVKDFGPDLHYIKAYLPHTSALEGQETMFWEETVSTAMIPDVFVGGDNNLGRLM
uniref:Uncharacterized protein n=1 Tax=Ditylenchus dipsaci TaxID=166011 RepID=A0A915EQR3_9BILA